MCFLNITAMGRGGVLFCDFGLPDTTNIDLFPFFEDGECLDLFLVRDRSTLSTDLGDSSRGVAAGDLSLGG